MVPTDRTVADGRSRDRRRRRAHARARARRFTPCDGHDGQPQSLRVAGSCGGGSELVSSDLMLLSEG